MKNFLKVFVFSVAKNIKLAYNNGNSQKETEVFHNKKISNVKDDVSSLVYLLNEIISPKNRIFPELSISFRRKNFLTNFNDNNDFRLYRFLVFLL